MSLSALAFSTMGVFIKHLSPGIPYFQLIFFRSFINFFVVGLVMAIQGQAFFPGETRLLVSRGFAGFFSLMGFFYTLRHLPLSIAIMIGWCAPLFVFIFSWALLGESIRLAAFRWVGLAFVGLLMIMRPDFSGGAVASLSLFAMGIGILGSASAALAYVAVRAATARIGGQAIIFYFVAISTLISAPFAARGWVSPDSRQWMELILMGICATLGQYALTHAYRFGAAGVVSTMGLVGGAYSAVFGWVLFDEKLTLVQGAGMLVLAGGIVMLTLSSQKMSGAAVTQQT